jgi:hypothetical protein
MRRTTTIDQLINQQDEAVAEKLEETTEHENAMMPM